MSEMTMPEHLGELRSRLVKSILVVLVISVLLFFLEIPDIIIERIRSDVVGALPLYAFTFSEAIMLKLKLSFVLGVIICFPFLFFQLWVFISPGLTERERKVVALLLTPSIILFALGALFAYRVVLPPLIGFLLAQTAGMAEARIQITRALEFVGIVLLLGGVVFQLPLIMAILSRMHVCDWRFFLKNARYFLFAIIAAEIILTDVSVIIQVVVAFLVMIAYGAGIIVSFFLGKR